MVHASPSRTHALVDGERLAGNTRAILTRSRRSAIADELVLWSRVAQQRNTIRHIRSSKLHWTRGFEDGAVCRKFSSRVLSYVSPFQLCTLKFIGHMSKEMYTNMSEHHLRARTRTVAK